MKLALVLLIVGMVCIAGVSYIGVNCCDEEEVIVIKNPSTGETWDSIEAFEYRNLNLSSGDNG